MIEKLKKFFNKKYAEKADKAVMLEYGFLPINEQRGTLYVACSEYSQKLENKVKEYFSQNLKFIPVDKGTFTALFDFIFPKSDQKEEKIEKDEKKIEETTKKAEKQQEKVKEKEPENEHEKEVTKEKRKEKPEEKEPVRKKCIGEMLVEKGYVTEKDIEKALVQSLAKKEPLGSTLVKMNLLSVEQLKEVLSEQQGIEAVNEKKLRFSDKLLESFPKEFLEENKLVPISSDGKTIVVGMVNPNDKKVLKDIVFFTGLKPIPRLLTYYEYDSSVKSYLKDTERKAKLFEHISSEDMLTPEESLADKVEKDIKNDESSISKFTNQIVTDAIDMKASDIHIEPRFTSYVVRYRIDGILRKMIEIPANVEASVISRFKVLAKMNIAEHRRAQDGAFSLRHRTKTYDFRINTIPVGTKEKMVIRILQPSVSLTGEEKDIVLSGAYPEDIKKLEWMIKIPYGIILAAGPTGSGKTTTLYSILNSLNEDSVNITTIEDPVEIRLEGVNQIQVNPKADITFASCLRAILRQDPDIILVGEIRDFETLEAAIAAALTGHVVLSTVHTNSAAATVSRLMQMGAPNYLIASSLSGVVAQRLVRRLCPYCKTKYHATEEELRQILLNPEDIQEFMKKELYKPVGCPQCQYTGFLGRIGLFELMPVTKEMRKLIAQSASDVAIEELAIGCGMKTLQQYCLTHILNGETPVSEFVRVLGVVSD